jgi:hypothetical protein
MFANFASYGVFSNFLCLPKLLSPKIVFLQYIALWNVKNVVCSFQQVGGRENRLSHCKKQYMFADTLREIYVSLYHKDQPVSYIWA